jgi:branched-chain amino acid transport system ATP-binding protein
MTPKSYLFILEREKKVLNVNNLDVYYGSVCALRDVSITVEEKEIVTLIGANGAGKTTLMMTVSGILKPKSGTIKFMEKRIDTLYPHEIVSLGISQVSQGRNLFVDMTVLENLELGAYRFRKKSDHAKKLEEIYSYFEILRKYRNKKAKLLSGGEQQMLAFGRAIMGNSNLLLMDEPSAGLAPLIVMELAEIIKKLRKSKGLTTLIVEQNAILALDLADRGYVLETGRLVTEGEASVLKENDLVKKAYLGI